MTRTRSGRSTSVSNAAAPALVPGTRRKATSRSKGLKRSSSVTSASQKVKASTTKQSKSVDRESTPTGSTPGTPTGEHSDARSNGNIVVVPTFPGYNATHRVHLGTKNEPLDATLTYVNIATNNNKFYALQLLSGNPNRAYCPPGYVVVARYGRIGQPGDVSEWPFTSEAEAIKSFCSKFRQKSGVTWENRRKPAPAAHQKKSTYVWLEKDHRGPEIEQPQDSGFQNNKKPLGYLSSSSIIKATSVLTKLADLILAPQQSDQDAALARKATAMTQSDRYFTLIPHVSNSGASAMGRLHVIETVENIREELAFIRFLDYLNAAQEACNALEISLAGAD